MGLDQYLYRKTYVKNWDNMPLDHLVHIELSGDQNKIKHIDINKITFIVEEVAYWRKANQIHAWFVEHCQKGVDECQESYVPMEKLQELLDICKKIKANPTLGPNLLPTQSGFFFGNTDYGDFYLDDIELTINQLTPLVENPDIYADYYYRSSW